jgi:hypothetical protein
VNPRRDRPQKRDYPRLTRLRGTDTKRRRVEEYLASLGPEQFGVATGSSVAAAMVGRGLLVNESYAGRILGEWRVDHRPPRKTRRR